jgi:hypothetical protein
MRAEYQSLAKKSLLGKEFMKKYDMGGGEGKDLMNLTSAW